MPYAPIYRYAVGIFGANYAQPDQDEPGHWMMAQTLNDARDYLGHASLGRGSAGAFFENGNGEPALNTPVYGREGDGAYIYRVNREHLDFSEVLDEPGDRARHAFGYIDLDYPAYVATFGPRRGLQIRRA